MERQIIEGHAQQHPDDLRADPLPPQLRRTDEDARHRRGEVPPINGRQFPVPDRFTGRPVNGLVHQAIRLRACRTGQVAFQLPPVQGMAEN